MQIYDTPSGINPIGKRLGTKFLFSLSIPPPTGAPLPQSAMDCMSFVPGLAARDAIEEANGRITGRREDAIRFAGEFVLNCPSGPQPLLYQTCIAMMKNGDEVDIRFNIREPTATEEEDPAGELIGHAWATLKDGVGGNEKFLWEVGRRTQPLSDADVAKAFNAYRVLLAAHNGLPVPEPVQIPTDETPAPTTAAAAVPAPRAISRALSPSNLFFASVAMFYFVDLSMVPPSRRREFLVTPLHLSRPMPAVDALILAAFVCLAIGAPPLVFAVVQDNDSLGALPQSYSRASYALAPKSGPNDRQIIIVG